jgi:hypothetical protein
MYVEHKYPERRTVSYFTSYSNVVNENDETKSYQVSNYTVLK